jgi:hypothetical protein
VTPGALEKNSWPFVFPHLALLHPDLTLWPTSSASQFLPTPQDPWTYRLAGGWKDALLFNNTNSRDPDLLLHLTDKPNTLLTSCVPLALAMLGNRALGAC